jgi:segregation and condensation protein A
LIQHWDCDRTAILVNLIGRSILTVPDHLSLICQPCRDPMNVNVAPAFQVDLQQYRGPLDLLLYLVRRHELEVGDVSIHRIALQYLEYLDRICEVDIDHAGDFLEMTSLLVEMKLRAVLPRSDEEQAMDDTDPREDLVRRLLLYKEFKDVSMLLGERSLEWQSRYPRLANDLPPRKVDLAEQPIEEVELWDLVSSFGRVLKNNTPQMPESIVLDETPIHVYMQQIHRRLARQGHLRFSEMFEPGMHKSAMVGIFLAILELVRHHSVHTEQIGEHGDIQLLPGEKFDQQGTIDESVDY